MNRDSELNGDVKTKNIGFGKNNTQEIKGIVPVSTLETIKDDCLREIVQYLDIMDIVNLATISGRLLQFAEAIIFPKAVKEICVAGHYERNQLPTLFYNQNSVELKCGKRRNCISVLW